MGLRHCHNFEDFRRLAFGDLSFEESARSVELMAREVMPALA